MQAKVINEMDMFRMGPTITFMSPSGHEFTIRERNGEDEDILSKQKDTKDGSSINKFLSAIIVNPKLSDQDIQSLPSKDKYYILFKSRIQSLGDKVHLNYTFQKEQYPVPFEIDLNEYDWDFANPNFPKEGDQDYFKYRCSPYPAEIRESPQFILELSSGKKIRMYYLTGVGEAKTLGKTEGDLTINDRLRIRGFEVQGNSGEWIKMERFNMFTSREMAEMRTKLFEKDTPFDLIAELTNPKTGAVEAISLFQTEDFFFPTTL